MNLVRFTILMMLAGSVVTVSSCAKYRVTKAKTGNPSTDDSRKFGEPAEPAVPNPEPVVVIEQPVFPREEISGNQITVYGDGFYIQSLHTAGVGECVPFEAFQCGPNNEGQVYWVFGDGYEEVGTQLQKGYDNEGSYPVSATCSYPGLPDQTLQFTITVTPYVSGCH